MRVLPLTVLVAGLACAPSFRVRGTSPEPGRDPAPGVVTPQPALTSKKVVGKEEPNILVAEDMSRCKVSKEKYDSTQIGERAFCIWSRV